jgi:hypothetical protein
MALQVDFTMVAGDTKTIVFNVKDSGGAALDLTGATIRWGLCAYAASGAIAEAALLTKSVGSGITVTDAAGGVCQVALSAANTTATPRMSGRYYHELEVTSGGVVSTVHRGLIEITPELLVT